MQNIPAPGRVLTILNFFPWVLLVQSHRAGCDSRKGRVLIILNLFPWFLLVHSRREGCDSRKGSCFEYFEFFEFLVGLGGGLRDKTGPPENSKKSKYSKYSKYSILKMFCCCPWPGRPVRWIPGQPPEIKIFKMGKIFWTPGCVF